MADAQNDVMEKERAILIDALRSCAMNDKSKYYHHQPRARDGKLPKEEGGTIWKTPREIALDTLKGIGVDTASLFPPYENRNHG